MVESDIKVYRPQSNRKRIGEENIFKVINFQRVSERAIVKIKWISQARLLYVRRSGTAVHLKWWSVGLNTQ